jgi:hypothetical protein
MKKRKRANDDILEQYRIISIDFFDFYIVKERKDQ